MALIGAQYVQAVDPNPVGSLQAFAGANAPTGWLLCNGSVVSQGMYPELFSVISSTYNTSGEGAGNFRLPDLRGRMPLGAGNDSTAANNATRTLGTKGGDTRSELLYGNVSHTGAVPIYEGTGGSNWRLSAGATGVTLSSTGGGSTLLMTNNGGTGSGANMPPFLVTNYIIKATSSVPRSGTALGSTPPIVTALPANPQFGEQVTLLVTSPYTGYQSLQYNGSSWITLDDSRAMGAWQTFTPTMSGGTWAPGNGSFAAYYTQIGKTVFYRGQFTFGSTTVKASGNGLAISMPVTSAPALQAQGSANYLDSGTEWYIGECELSTSTTMTFGAPLVNGTALIYRGLTSTTPFTWATNDLIRWSITYEAA